jgi:hypothetical protein
MSNYDKIKKDLSKMGFDFFEGDYGLSIHNEGEGDIPFDYYGEFTGGYPWINPKLVKMADKFNGYWEWVNPAVIVFAE